MKNIIISQLLTIVKRKILTLFQLVYLFFGYLVTTIRNNLRNSLKTQNHKKFFF